MWGFPRIQILLGGRILAWGSTELFLWSLSFADFLYVIGSNNLPHCVSFLSSADGLWKQMSTTHHRRPLKKKTVTMAKAWKAPGTDCGVSPQDKLPHYKKGMLILSWLPFTLQNNHLVGICETGV